MLSNKIPMSRRAFIRNSLVSTTAFAYMSTTQLQAAQSKLPLLRLGGPTFEKFDSPDAWVKAVRKLGYTAAYCPIGAREKDDVVKAYARAAKKADIIIAEVGSKPMPAQLKKLT